MLQVTASLAAGIPSISVTPSPAWTGATPAWSPDAVLHASGHRGTP